MLSRETLHHRPTPQKLLARVLETPELGAQIRSLPSPVLGKLIDHVGLEDAAELVALATTEQLSQIFDADLWRSERPGEDERFDAQRFLLWLEIMLEAGERFVADRLAELPQELVTLAFHRHLLDGMPAGYAAEDGAALRFVGDELVEVVASRPEARAYKLERRGSRVLETRLATRYLGAEAPAALIPLAVRAAA